MSIEGQVCIVTGASKGIGRTTALAFAGDGRCVVAVARTAALLKELAAEASTLPGEIVAAPGDVSQPQDVKAVVDQALSRYGRIDVLVNNAGVELVKPVDEVTDEDYALTLDTNVKGVFLFSRAVIPVMKEQGSGTIINIASSAGLRGFAGDAIYCASKFGVVGFTDALDEELRPFGIRVSCISPGAVNTELAMQSWSPPDDPYRPHFLQPADVARAILFVVEQPSHVSIRQLSLLPLVEPPYSPLLPLEGD